MATVKKAPAKKAAPAKIPYALVAGGFSLALYLILGFAF